MLERESSREKNLEKSAKEAKVKARKEAAKTAEQLDSVTEDELAQVGGWWVGGIVLVRGAAAHATHALELKEWRSQNSFSLPLLLSLAPPLQLEKDFFAQVLDK